MTASNDSTTRTVRAEDVPVRAEVINCPLPPYRRDLYEAGKIPLCLPQLVPQSREYGCKDLPVRRPAGVQLARDVPVDNLTQPVLIVGCQYPFRRRGQS